jgi:hypothetical protein
VSLKGVDVALLIGVTSIFPFKQQGYERSKNMVDHIRRSRRDIVCAAIYDMGRELFQQGTTATFRQLIERLNSQGVVSPSTGQPYQYSARGIASAVAMAFRWVHGHFGWDEAKETIGDRFVNEHGNYAR